MDTTEKAVLPRAIAERGSTEKRPGLSDRKAGGGDVENGLPRKWILCLV